MSLDQILVFFPVILDLIAVFFTQFRSYSGVFSVILDLIRVVFW